MSNCAETRDKIVTGRNSQIKENYFLPNRTSDIHEPLVVNNSSS